ncbi:hypothetical protein [Pseudoalteromonas sp. SR43-5]|uniref:hypothetical protein n=1 Tax=Pseudoalteromonas sp. SR43-5 TaxID=2760941 RepID=UPI0015F95B2E|nr:hypothetical protein [Pseudoalteromonas sp. SR43-5]MBB1307302.1 hypothetical protein [Pseudoalteromonas sp. SR43-5]
MAAFTASQLSINNGKNSAVINSDEAPEQVQYGDFLVVGDFAPAQINRTYVNTDNLHVIELVKPWRNSNQLNQPAIVIPTTVNFKDTVNALKDANTLINDNMQAMQDWQTKEGQVTFSNLDGTQTAVKTLKQMELEFNALLARFGGNLPTDPVDPEEPTDPVDPEEPTNEQFTFKDQFTWG